MSCKRDNTHTPLSRKRRLCERENKNRREGKDESPSPQRVMCAHACVRERIEWGEEETRERHDREREIVEERERDWEKEK